MDRLHTLVSRVKRCVIDSRESTMPLNVSREYRTQTVGMIYLATAIIVARSKLRPLISVCCSAASTFVVNELQCANNTWLWEVLRDHIVSVGKILYFKVCGELNYGRICNHELRTMPLERLAGCWIP